MSWGIDGKGRIRVPTAGIRCPDSQLIQASGFQGDVGVGFSIYYADSVTIGYYPVFDPLRLNPERPGGAAALRWFTGTSLAAFEGYGGWMAVDTVAADTISGRFEVRMRGLDRVDTLTLTGTFEQVPLSIEASCSLRRN